MTKKGLRITYLFESTALWGGTKVALEQAEALSDAGFEVTLLSKDSGPTWYPLKLPIISVPSFVPDAIPESDVIIGTYWPTVKAAVESQKGLVVHLCQGYEGDYKELQDRKAEIDEVYSYEIPKLTVSPHLTDFLKSRFRAEAYYVGQMLNRNVFYPASNRIRDMDPPGFRILVVGPFEVDFKNIAFTLRGVCLAKRKLGSTVKLLRVSQFPLTREERVIIEPDVYHLQVPHFSMGDIYRSADLFASMSKEAEGFGLPALEAMACGVPTLLSRISSYTSFDQPCDYALFLNPEDPEKLAGAIEDFFQNTPLREKYRQRGLAVSRKFTKEAVVKRLEAAFNEIICMKKTRRVNRERVNLKRFLNRWERIRQALRSLGYFR